MRRAAARIVGFLGDSAWMDHPLRTYMYGTSPDRPAGSHLHRPQLAGRPTSSIPLINNIKPLKPT